MKFIEKFDLDFVGEGGVNKRLTSGFPDPQNV